MERLQCAFGLLALVSIAWAMSTDRKKMNWRIIAGGILLQLLLAFLLLRTAPGLWVFEQLGRGFNAVLGYVDQGSEFLFAVHPRTGDPAGFPPPQVLLRTMAFGVLPSIVFFSSLMAILYHLRVMQPLVAAMGWLMRRTLGTSGAESLSAAANIFVGQTEAPLMVRPYVGEMTQSELMAMMVGGFATIAGGVMGAYVKLGFDAGHLMTASVISAPAALLVAKVMQPEVESPRTLGGARVRVEQSTRNVVDAAAQGAIDGLWLALNVAAMLIAFVALIHLVDGILGLVGRSVASWFSEDPARGDISLSFLMGYAFYPVAWLIGIPGDDRMTCAQLLGTRMVLNEFVAYGEMARPEIAGQLSARSKLIMTYALCGFANFGSIGIQIGGIGSIAPHRRGDLAALGLRAMIGGTLASLMTACVAGILVN